MIPGDGFPLPDPPPPVHHHYEWIFLLCIMALAVAIAWMLVGISEYARQQELDKLAEIIKQEQEAANFELEKLINASPGGKKAWQ
jgi:hypothetical protein